MRLDAVVYPDRDGFHVKLLVLDNEVDVAGPFDDVTDAILMAERTVYGGGDVRVVDMLRATDGIMPRSLLVTGDVPR